MADIEEQFNLIAKKYDVNRRKFIPCFDDYYESTTKMILDNIDSPRRVLDLRMPFLCKINFRSGFRSIL